MSATSIDPPKYRLKVTAGPLKGARFPLAETVTIGRSSQVEIFVADAGVSRRHAKVFPLPDGSHVLIDLGSANGTRIDGEPIAEHRLEIGQAFTVGGTTFEYEIAVPTPAVAPERGTYAVSSKGGSSVERTIVMLPNEDATMTARFEPRPDQAYMPAPAAGDLEPHRARRGDPPQEVGKRIEARTPEGGTYPGDLVSDVILYRNLRLRSVRGDALPQSVRTSYEQLEQRLRAPSSELEHPDRSREFARFSVCFPAHLRFSRSEDTGHPVEIRDFGVGGSRLSCPGLSLDLDELTWLAIDLVGPNGARTIVFTARVVWMQSDEMGLVFSGAPGWARHSGSTEAEDTLVLERDRVPAARAMTRPVKLRLASNGGDRET